MLSVLPVQIVGDPRAFGGFPGCIDVGDIACPSKAVPTWSRPMWRAIAEQTKPDQFDVTMCVNAEVDFKDTIERIRGFVPSRAENFRAGFVSGTAEGRGDGKESVGFAQTSCLSRSSFDC